MRDEIGHCDNPLVGIYNHYQIKNQPFAFLASFSLHIFLLSFYYYLTKQLELGNYSLCADKTQTFTYKQLKTLMKYRTSHSPCASPGPNLTEHLSYTKPCQPE